MRLTRALATTAVALTLLAPLAAAQEEAAAAAAPDESKRPTSLITFYGHVFAGTRFAPMPMNVEFPEGEEDFSAGYGDTCGPLPADPNAELVLFTVRGDCDAEELNEVWLYSTAGFVNVVDGSEFDYEAIHNERGLTKDTFLDANQDVTATVYMSADGHPWLSTFCGLDGTKPYDIPEPMGCWNWDPGMLRGWTVRATLFVGVLGEYGGEANTAPDVATAFSSGALEVLAEGQTQPVDVLSLEASGNPTVWRFDVNLGKPKTNVIPKEKSYLVRFEWWSDLGGSKVVLPPNWNFNSGQYFPPSITIPVKNAFDVESVIPQFVYDKLVILGIINTPWGSYDVDQDSVKLTIAKAGGEEVVPVRIQKLADYSVAHGGHYKPVNVTYVWDYKADKLPAGKYDAKISASNFQGSASGECSATFEILPGGRPGPITVGACAVQTLTAEQLARINQGLNQTEDGKRAPLALPVPPAALGKVPVGVQAAAIAPRADLGVLPLALGLAAALGVAVLRRRWA